MTNLERIAELLNTLTRLAFATHYDQPDVIKRLLGVMIHEAHCWLDELHNEA